jgi:hypothetical protein
MSLQGLLVESGRSLLLAIFAAILVMSIYSNIGHESCADVIGENAPGGGAAFGMVLLSTGMVVFLWSVFFEAILRSLKAKIVIRFAFLMLPPVFVWGMAIYSFQWVGGALSGCWPN